MIDIQKITAIDVHTHAEVSCCQPHDDYRSEFDVALPNILSPTNVQPFRKRLIFIETVTWRS